MIIDCFATWCGPCKTIAPKVVALSNSHPFARFYKIDVDELPEVAQELGVRDEQRRVRPFTHQEVEIVVHDVLDALSYVHLDSSPFRFSNRLIYEAIPATALSSYKIFNDGDAPRIGMKNSATMPSMSASASAGSNKKPSKKLSSLDLKAVNGVSFPRSPSNSGKPKRLTESSSSTSSKTPSTDEYQAAVFPHLTLVLCRTTGDFHRFHIKPLLVFQIPN